MSSKPEQRDQQILTMQEKYDEKLCQKELEIFTMKLKIFDLESEIQLHKKDIRERDETIGEKEKL